MNQKKDDLPAMPFYVGDWFKCTEVRALPPDYRGLWFDMICYMWESVERGVMVKPNGKPYSDAEIIRMVGLDNQNSDFWLTRLLEDGVCARREDGAIYSKRMVKDEVLRALRREIGRKGGNPELLVKRRLTKYVNQNVEDEIEDENEVKVLSKNKPISHETGKAPSLEEVTEYISEKGSKIDPKAFWAYYEANGWMQGKKPIKKWKACVTTWEQRRAEFAPVPSQVQGKPMAEVVALQCVALKMDDQAIKQHMIEKGYAEHRIVEAISKARGEKLK
jgi:hypothetical protein